MVLELDDDVARLLLPAIAVELRHEGKFMDEDQARSLRVLMKVIDEKLRGIR
jgi:hypothetical protein